MSVYNGDDTLGESRIGKRERIPTHETPNQDDPEEVKNVIKLYIDIMKEDSPFFSARSSCINLPEFEAQEISVGKTLGHGEFGIVFPVIEFHIEEADDDCDPSRVEVTTEKEANETSESQADGDELPSRPSTPISSISPSAVYSGHASSKGTNPAADSDSSAIQRIPLKGHIGRKDSTVSFAENPVSVMIPVEDDASDNSSLSDDDEDLGGLDDKKLQALNVSKSYMKSHVLRDGKPRYAVKRVRRDITGDKLFYAISDLASEANFLKSLRHPNICKMRGTVGQSGKIGFGIILDRLDMTLREKMLAWKKEDDGGSFFSKLERFLHHPHNKKEEELQVHKERYTEKLVALYDSARALRYLAKHSIIFRDLKPENLAFDYRGDLRLFDFGLAKELKADKRIAEGKYELTGLTGSRRYMAPEVILCKYYGLPADVYSFAVMFWEVMSNHNAYHYMSFEKHFEMVVTRKKRPDIKKLIPHKDVLPEGSNIHHMVEQSWDPDPSKRPTIGTICDMLADELKEVSEGENGSIGEMDRTAFLVTKSLRSRAEVP